MNRRLLLLTACAAAVVTRLAPPIAVATAPIVTVDPPVHVSAADADRVMGELLVAADPFDAQRLVACGMVYSNDENRMWVSAYRTLDRGRTWSRVLETRGPVRTNEADPSCAFGRDGRVYVATISHKPYGSFTTEVFLRLFRSLDSGSTWSEPLKIPVSSYGFDREYMAVDVTGGPHDGTLYMNSAVSLRVAGGGRGQDAVALWVSRDHAATFDAPLIRMPPLSQTILPRANGIVMSDGTFVSLFGERNGRSPAGLPVYRTGSWTPLGRPDAQLRIATSGDGGRSFELGSRIADCFMSPTLGLGAELPYIAVDPGSLAFKDRLYVVWPDSRSGRSEILLSYSADKGTRWSPPIFVNDDHGIDRPPGSGDHTLPVVAVNRDGVVGVMWYDRRAVEGFMGWDVRFAASVDGGQTFLPSVLVSSATSRFGKELRLGTFGFVDDRMDLREGHLLQLHVQGRQFFAGDTAGMTADAGGLFHPVWIDHRTGIPQLWTASVHVEGGAVRNGSIALERLIDVSTSIALDVQATLYDQRSGEVSATVALRNTSGNSLPLPLMLRVLGVTSDIAQSVAALNADNGSGGSDAVWAFGDERGDRLDPQATTQARILRFRATGIRSFKKDVGYRTGLLMMRARILGSP